MYSPLQIGLFIFAIIFFIVALVALILSVTIRGKQGAQGAQGDLGPPGDAGNCTEKTFTQVRVVSPNQTIRLENISVNNFIVSKILPTYTPTLELIEDTSFNVSGQQSLIGFTGPNFVLSPTSQFSTLKSSFYRILLPGNGQETSQLLNLRVFDGQTYIITYLGDYTTANNTILQNCIIVTQYSNPQPL